MKFRIFALVLVLAFVLLGAGVLITAACNIWYAGSHPVAAAPTMVEEGRLALHNQLYQATLREAEIEKLYWNEPAKLQILIQSHQQRIAQLEGNPAAGEIIAYDQQSIVRLQQRITARYAEWAAQTAAREAAEAEADADATADPQTTPQPAHP